MEWLTQYFQWGPESMPRYVGFLTLLFGVATWLFVEGHSLKARKLAAKERAELSSAYEKIGRLEDSILRAEIKKTLPPANNLRLEFRDGLIGLFHNNPDELSIIYKFSGTIQGGHKVGEGDKSSVCGLKSGGYVGFGSESEIFKPFNDQALLKDCRDIMISVWLANSDNQTLVKKFTFVFKADKAGLISNP